MGTQDIMTLYLTPNAPSWNPHNNSYETQEFDKMDNNGIVIVEMKPTYLISDVVSSVTVPHLLCDALVRRCKISNVPTEEEFSMPICNCIMEDGLLQGDRNPNGSTHVVSMVESSSAKSNLSPQRLAKVFDISLDDAI